MTVWGITLKNVEGQVLHLVLFPPAIRLPTKIITEKKLRSAHSSLTSILHIKDEDNRMKDCALLPF
jgi:hypothetical protein